MVEAAVPVIVAPAVNLLAKAEVMDPKNPCELVPVLLSPELVVVTELAAAAVPEVLVERLVWTKLDEDCVKIDVFAVPFIPIHPGKVDSISSPRTP